MVPLWDGGTSSTGAKGTWCKAALLNGGVGGVPGTVPAAWGITQASLSSPGFAIAILAGAGRHWRH